MWTGAVWLTTASLLSDSALSFSPPRVTTVIQFVSDMITGNGIPTFLGEN